MNTQKKARSLYWDIVKGWGIIAIVLGHTGYFAGAFVYLFHLALFFFITGYFYNETKYGDTPFLYFGSRLAGAWPRYMFYTLFFVLLHNFFVTHRLYAGQELYNHTRMLTAWMSSLSFNSPEQVQGALWFLPVWLVSSGLFAGCVWFGRAAARFTRKDNVKLPVCAFACILIGLAGVFLNMRSCPLPYNLQAALLVAAYVLDCVYFIPASSYFPLTTPFIEGSIFVGTVCGMLVALELVNDSAIVNDERSKRDSLTKLYNHESFYEELEYYQRRYEENRERFSLAVIDIDNFKNVNDTYGHAFGDVVLKEVADICARHKGAAGFCARYGGEEFAIIFKGAGVGQAEEMAEQIRQEFEQKMFTTPQGERSFSVSIGVAEYDRAYPGASAFFEVADAALYCAKREGKNQVRR